MVGKHRLNDHLINIIKDIYACVKPLIDPLLPKEQAGFRSGKSTVDQVVLLTQNIEDSFEAKKKTGTVFVDLNNYLKKKAFVWPDKKKEVCK